MKAFTIGYFRVFAVMIWIFVFSSAYSQQNERLWNRMIYLRDSNTSILPEQQLREFLKYNQQEEIKHALPDSTHAFLLQRIGIQYLKLQHYKEAISYTNRSIQIEEKHSHLSGQQVQILCNDYYNIYYCYYILHNYVRIREAIDSCIAAGMRYKVWDYKLVHSFAEKSRFTFQAGDYESCIKIADLGLNVIRLYYRNDDSLEFIFRLDADRINALLQLGKYDEAETSSKIIIAHFSPGSRRMYASTLYILLAKALEGKGYYDSALVCLDQSFDYSRKEKFYSNCGEALAEKAFLYYSGLHEDQQALHYFRQALHYSNTTDSLFIWDNIANIYAHLKAYPEALVALKNAFGLIGANANESDLIDLPFEQTSQSVIQYVSDLVLDKAAIYLNKYKSKGAKKDLLEAIRIYKSADAFFDKIRNQQNETQSTLFWRRDNRRLYGNAIEASYLNNNPDDAFFFFEKSRAVVLSDELNRLDLSSDSEISNQAGIKLRINEVEKQLAGTGVSPTEYARLEAEELQLKQDLHESYEKIRVNKPLFFQTRLDSNAISIKEVQRDLLKNRDAFLEIFEADSFVYFFKVSTGDTRFLRINATRFDSLRDLYLSEISDPSRLNNGFERFLSCSRQLYKMIIEPMALDAGRLIVSTDLENIPFEALVTGKEGEPLQYLIEKIPVSYSYSARYLLNNYQSDKPASSDKNFIGFAPEKFSRYPALASLEGSARSMKSIQGGLQGAEAYLFTDASLQHFLQHFSDYRIIQLYTHGSANVQQSDPVIYFADSALHLSGLISDKKPLTRLIVLSGCETGIGKSYEGEGIFSFSRGFAELGIPASIGNLWAIDSRSTYWLTELFYKYLAENLPVDEALQKAKIEFLEKADREHRLPYYWASTILVGSSGPLPVQKEFPLKWTIVLSLVFLISLYVLIKWLRKK